jgi:NAD(P)-dependent dehydrogenase (short-subunit alcohol dehydrogenase family)
MSSLSGNTIVVTGVSSGIGKAAAHYLVTEGADVIGLDRGEPPADLSLADFHLVDLGEPASITSFASKIDRQIDGIANVAGASSATPIETQFRVNFLGTRYLLQSLTPALAATASVVNVAAGAALHWRDRIDSLTELLATNGFEDGLEWLKRNPQIPSHSYARSKEALVMWTYQTAVDWVGSGRRINAVSPGPVETPMLNEFRSIIGANVIAEDAKRSGRAATAEDIAPVIAFLMRDESAWIHGANIAADGGFSASALLSREGWAY